MLEAFIPLESSAFLLLPAPAGSLLSGDGGILRPCKFSRVPVGSGGQMWLRLGSVPAARHRRARLRASGSAVTRESLILGGGKLRGKTSVIVSAFGDSCLHALLFREFPVTWEARGIVCSCLWFTWTSSPSPPGILCQQRFLGGFSGLSKLLLAPFEVQNAAL